MSFIPGTFFLQVMVPNHRETSRLGYMRLPNCRVFFGHVAFVERTRARHRSTMKKSINGCLGKVLWDLDFIVGLERTLEGSFV